MGMLRSRRTPAMVKSLVGDLSIDCIVDRTG